MLTSQTKFRRTRVAKNAAIVPRTTPDSASAEPFTDDGAENPLARRAKRHADAELTRALRDRVRDQPVDAGRGQQQADDREDAENRHLERSAAIARCLDSSIVLNVENGWRGSTARICSSISRISAAAGRSARTTQLT